MDNDIYKLASDKIENLQFDDCSHMVKMARDAVLDSHKEIEEPIRIKAEALIAKHEREEKYKNDVLNTLLNIEKNTDNLNNIVGLIKDSNANQQEIINIITELLSISKEVNKEKAESKYKAILSNITSLAESADTITKLITFATTIHGILQTNGILV